MGRWFMTGLNRYWGAMLILALWQSWVSVSKLNAIVLPQPADVLIDIITHPALYIDNGFRTLIFASGGLMLGFLVGMLIAIGCWLSRLAAGMLVPLAILFSSVPVVALIPVIARLLGYDFRTVLAIVVIISFFPAFVFASAGLRALPAGAEDLFTVLGGHRLSRLIHLALPAALPNLMIALRLAAPAAVLSTMLAEFLMGQAGLGYMFRTASEDFATERAFGTSAIATTVAVFVFTLAKKAETEIDRRWH